MRVFLSVYFAKQMQNSWSSFQFTYSLTQLQNWARNWKSIPEVTCKDRRGQNISWTVSWFIVAVFLSVGIWNRY